MVTRYGKVIDDNVIVIIAAHGHAPFQHRVFFDYLFVEQ
jgi:hypothetical protein